MEFLLLLPGVIVAGLVIIGIRRERKSGHVRERQPGEPTELEWMNAIK